MLKASILNNDSQNALLNTAIKYEKGFIVNILPNRLQLQLSKGIRLPKLLHHIKSIIITCTGVIRTTGSFPLLEDLSSELQVLIHAEGQLKRITPSAIP